MTSTLRIAAVLTALLALSSCDYATEDHSPEASELAVNAGARVDEMVVNFDGYPDRYDYRKADVERDFGRILYDYGTDGRTKIRDRRLQVTYPAGVIKKPGGIRYNVGVTPRKEYVLQYKVKFEGGFDWRKGGKLPGLGGTNGTPRSGEPRGYPTTGCDPMDGNGWSARLMWKSGGKIIAYVYYQNKPPTYNDGNPNLCGDNMAATPFYAQTDTYYVIQVRVKMNTGTHKNGSLLVRIKEDGTSNWETLADRNDIRWMDSGHRINELLFHSWYGGNDSSWAPTRTSRARFDSVNLWAP